MGLVEGRQGRVSPLGHHDTHKNSAALQGLTGSARACTLGHAPGTLGSVTVGHGAGSASIHLRVRTSGMKLTPERVEKPWGFELIWAHTDDYVGKILHINAGESLSLQFHERKDETIHLLSGQMHFWVGTSQEDLQRVVLERGESFRVTPGTVHRMEAVTECDILEASTPFLDDVVRLEDRYGRRES